MYSIHQKYMQRCLNLALLGNGFAAPNPMVGSVIVHKGKIIGEGFHRKCGEPHAEVNAINSVKNQSLLKESTLYVNLEPCAHYGKTPPCSDLIVSKGIPEVVIGTIDPFAKVAGKGIEKLKNGGCKVIVDILKDECLELNKRFFTFHAQKRPYIILKWAQSSDGFIDGHNNQPVWITNERCRMAVHKQRATEGAILIGTNTAVKDNPSLTLRDWSGLQPLRLVIDRNQKIPPTHQLFNKQFETIVFGKEKSPEESIDEVIDYLYNNNIISLIVEGGSKLLNSFIDNNLWDEAHVYTGNIALKKGTIAPEFSAVISSHENIGNSQLTVYRNR